MGTQHNGTVIITRVTSADSPACSKTQHDSDTTSSSSSESDSDSLSSSDDENVMCVRMT